MDFLSTWVATPNLRLEANPIARRLGWRWGIPVNLVFSIVFALWPLTAVIIATTSFFVAARNFQSAWLMRTAGERGYQHWMSDRFEETPRSLFLFCLVAQASLIAAVGVALVVFGGSLLIVMGIGVGIIAYAAAILIFTLLAVRRRRTHAY
jgi:hypothetical protein